MSEAWIERQTKSPEARKRYEEERLIFRTTEALCRAMDEQGLSKADLAEALGTSRAHITQLLSGSRNMTLRTLAGLAFEVGQRAGVELVGLQAGKFIGYPIGKAVRPRAQVITTIPDSPGETPPKLEAHDGEDRNIQLAA